MCQQAVITAMLNGHTTMSVPSFIRIERGLDRAHDIKHKKEPLFARKPVTMNVSRSAAPKVALVPANCYYCDVNWSYHNVWATFH